MKKEKAGFVSACFLRALFFPFFVGYSSLQAEVLIFLNDLEFLSASHLFRQFQVTDTIP